MPDLPVPDESIDAWYSYRQRAGVGIDDEEREVVRAVAGPVVAAVLRRIADEEEALPDRPDFRSKEADPRVFAERLRQHADKIDGGETAT